MNIKTRVTQLRKIMAQKNLDTMIISNFENQYYFSGLKAITYSRPILLVIEKEEKSLIIPTLEEKHAKHKTDADYLYVYHEIQNKEGETSYHTQVEKMLSNLKPNTTIGIEYNSLPSQISFMIEKAGFKLENIETDVTIMRAVKSSEEIKMIKESGKLVSQALKHSLENIKGGITELEVDYYGNSYLFKEISKEYPDSTFDYFVMSPSGLQRTNMPHVFSNSRKLEAKDTMIHSRQVGLNGYRAECERTLFVGEPTEEQKTAFNVMVGAQEAALNFIKVGITAKEVNEKALEVIRNAGLEEYVVHRTGHGIGIGLHEEPSLRFDNNLTLEAGMVFCIEPGIYIPEVGGFRHSDTVVLKEEGTEVITDYPKDLESLTIK